MQSKAVIVKLPAKLRVPDAGTSVSVKVIISVDVVGSRTSTKPSVKPVPVIVVQVPLVPALRVTEWKFWVGTANAKVLTLRDNATLAESLK